MSATIDNAERVDPRTLKVGDIVFDIWGNTYTLNKVKHFKHRVRFTRSDDYVDFFLYNSGTVTIVRGNDARY